MKQINLNLPENFSLLIVKQNTINGYVYETLNSTNSQAWQLIQQNIKPPFFVIAKQQTAGKGQRGNIWSSPLGGLYLSIVLEVRLSIKNMSHLILFSVSGIVTELRKFDIPVQIKWLNDLILDRKKLGGILLEIKTDKEIIKEVVIGIGINYENQIPDNGINLINYCQKTNNFRIKSIENLAEIVTLGIINGYQEYLNLGIDYVIDKYNNLMYNLHEKISIEQVQGKIIGIDSQGNLQVKITSSGASSKISFSAQNYSLSYDKSLENCYQLTEKK
ncbi:biotin--[acetyl-CoA-carboxylase] ligase [Geminocystis sp. NIES-3708]|uniref:biotin--[acetyl-CoA-carboxylase] ligase n=1 Tax=Geminocystis sp. NIES-3708 TaxID=1615909 RepID=UPI000A747B9A|nr:biotin--[acetyl-CoA-carboxylase] ligase [Geminocystis sp. NIES-3708]